MHLSTSESKALAERIAAANRAPRFHKLDRLERYAKGTQYEGRASWWNSDVPLQERAPCIRAPIAERAIRSHVDLCLGEGRFPRITSFLSEDDSAFDEDLGLSEKDSQLLDRFVCAIIDQAKLIDICVDGLSNALECGTTVAIARIDDEQKLAVDLEYAKHCTPKLAPNGKLQSLEIRYPYVAEVETNEPGKGKVFTYECRLYRRIIDEQRDVTFVAAKASENGGEPDAWTPDPALTFDHNLGFVPAIWWRRGKKKTTAAEIDGCAIHANLLDEIDGLNFSLSQRHRAARYAGDPQICEYGTSPEDVHAPQGRESRSAYAGDGDHPSNRRWVLDSKGKPMRAKGPGTIWTYENPASKCEYLTLPAGALDSLVGDVRDLYAMLRDAMGYVDSDPANIKIGGDVSGKTMEWLYTNAVNFCNRIRPDFSDSFLLPLVSLLLRLVSVKHASGETLNVPGFAKVAPILSRFAEQGRWQPPTMRCIWGAYFPLSEKDKKDKQERVLAASEAGIITRQTAVEEIACLYPTIKDPAAYLEALEEAEQEKLAKMHDAANALAKAGQEPVTPDTEQDAEGLPAERGEKNDRKQAPKSPNFRPKSAAAKDAKPVSIPAKAGRREVSRRTREVPS
jgi:hypothetical protein